MIIDAHMHVLRAEGFDKEAMAELGWPVPENTPIETIVGWLKDAGVSKAVVMAQEMRRAWNTTFGEDYLLECYKQYPDFFLPLASVEPVDNAGRTNWKDLEYFEYAIKELGFHGVLMVPPFGRYNSDDRNVYPFYEKALELDVVVQFHHCAQPGALRLAPFRHVNPTSINNVLVDFPELKVNLEHLNYPWYEEAFFMMGYSPSTFETNVYTDTSMNYDRPYILTWNLVKAKEHRHMDRIMWASDYYAPGVGVWSENPGEDIRRGVEMVKNGINEVAEKAGWPTFTQEDIDLMMYKNAARLYGVEISEEPATDEKAASGATIDRVNRSRANSLSEE